jgi:hypothetical protein
LHRGINKCEKGHQPRVELLKDEDYRFLQDFEQVGKLVSYKTFLVLGVNDVRQTEVHTAEPLQTELSYFETEVGIQNLEVQTTRYF